MNGQKSLNNSRPGNNLRVLVAALFFFVLTLSTAFAQNANDLPQISTKVKRTGKVVVTITKIASDVTKVEIQRRAGKGKFKTIAFKVPVNGVVKLVDNKIAKTQRYRAQFTFSSDSQSNWSIVSQAQPAATPSSNITATQTSNCPAGIITELNNAANAARAANGVGSLSEAIELKSSAQVHTNMMVRVNSLSHDFWIEEIKASGYTGGAIAQNVAFGYATPDSVINGWLGSPGHRKNLLNPVYNEGGFGCTIDAAGTYWWTHNFGAR